MSINSIALTNDEVQKFLRVLDLCYDEFDNLPCGNSYIMIDGDEVCMDTGYAFEGIDYFVKYIKRRLTKDEA